MKKTILLFTTIIVIAFVVGLLSFRSKSASKALTASCYRYDPPQSDPNKKRHISCGNTLSIVVSELRTANYWSPGTPSVTYTANGQYLRAICFLEEFDSDGGSDGELTLQEAIDAVADYFTSHSCTLPQDGGTITVDQFANIVIKRSDSNIN